MKSAKITRRQAGDSLPSPPTTFPACAVKLPSPTASPPTQAASLLVYGRLDQIWLTILKIRTIPVDITTTFLISLFLNWCDF